MSWLRKRRPNLDVRAASPRRLVRRHTPLTGEPPPATIRVADVHDCKTLDCFASHCIYQGVVEAAAPELVGPISQLLKAKGKSYAINIEALRLVISTKP